MSAPHSKGRHSQGEAKVLSSIRGMPWEWAISAIGSMSSTSPRGLPIVSPYTSLVRSVMASSTFSSREASTKVVWIPIRRSVTSNWVMVPPYRLRAATISSPSWQRVSTPINCAACPEAVASPPSPPSREAIRSSKAAVVGLLIRV